MGAEFAAERRLLSEEELPFVQQSHYPALDAAGREDLIALARWLRARRARAGGQSRRARCEYSNGQRPAGVGVTPEEIPWGDLAFPSTEYTLRRYLEDRARNEERHHFTEFDRRLPLR